MSRNGQSSDSTIARIAGNLLSGAPEDWLPRNPSRVAYAVKAAVATAREIVAEVEHSRPTPTEER